MKDTTITNKLRSLAVGGSISLGVIPLSLHKSLSARAARLGIRIVAKVDKASGKLIVWRFK